MVPLVLGLELSLNPFLYTLDSFTRKSSPPMWFHRADMKSFWVTHGWLSMTPLSPGTEVNSPDGRLIVYETALKTPCLSPACPPASRVQAQTTLPSVYTKYSEVFSISKATQLPPHRPWDCAIDLLPNISPPKSKIYPLSRPETQAMETYIDEADVIRHPPQPLDFSLLRRKTKGFVPVLTIRDWTTSRSNIVTLCLWCLQPWNRCAKPKSTPNSTSKVPITWFAFVRVTSGKLPSWPPGGTMSTLLCPMDLPTFPVLHQRDFLRPTE